jgi:hypothetical protein
MATQYVVKDENTLGYLLNPGDPFMGVLASNKHGHHPNGGPVNAINYRPPTIKDFELFRVAIPADF